jgi:hypothetical protein
MVRKKGLWYKRPQEEHNEIGDQYGYTFGQERLEERPKSQRFNGLGDEWWISKNGWVYRHTQG